MKRIAALLLASTCAAQAQTISASGYNTLYSNTESVLSAFTNIIGADAGGDSGKCLGANTSATNLYFLTTYTCSGGGGGSPGGSSGQVQYNNGGTFGGLTQALSFNGGIKFNSGYLLLGNGGVGSGLTFFASGNTGSNNYTITVPSVTDTLATIGTSQAFTAGQTMPSLAINGTAGSGFVSYVAESAAPAAPASGFAEYADSAGRFSWIRASDGFTRTWDATLTANRVYTLPDVTDTVVTLSATQTITNKSIAGSEVNSGTVAGTYLAAINLATSGNGGVTGNLPVGNLNSGAGASSTTFWRGDGVWGTPAGGGGGSPGGSNTQVQYNNAGSFGGISGVTTDGTVLTVAANDLRLLGSSTGYTTVATLNSSATNYTISFPAVTDTVAVLGTAQTFTAAITTTADINIGSTNALHWNGGRGSITSPTSASIQIGAADAVSPSAQTLRGQSVAAGVSNTAGPSLTVQAGTSTGSGTPGDLIFRTGGTGAGATAQNAYATGLTIKGATQLMVINTSYTVAGLPAGVTGARTYVTDQLTTCAGIGVAPTGGGSVFCPVFYNGSAWVGG